MQQVTNNSDIPLALAVWLMHDDYDYINDKNYISATKLLKPLKELILSARVPSEAVQIDVTDLVASALGKSIHAAIEKAWVNNYEHALKQLGYSEKVIENVLINPNDEDLESNKNAIPIYLEQRAFKEIAGKKVGGKYDFVAEGILHDFKSTSAYAWVHGTNDSDYQLQGSIYRWLNPEKITADFIRITFVFTDWQKAQANSNPKYPSNRLMYKDIPLLSLAETEKFIKNKLEQFTKYFNSPEVDIPDCTPTELWLSESVYKYYSNPDKTDGRATKNFGSMTEAQAHKATKGKGKGVIIVVKGEAKKCGYCNGAPVCLQKEKYKND